MGETQHFEKIFDAQLEREQSFFAIMRLGVASIVIPDFMRSERGKFAFETAKVALDEAVVDGDFGQIG